MSTTLIPQSFWFRLALPCQRVEGLPRPSGRLLDLPADSALPPTPRLDGREPWAEVRTAWNPGGLAIAVEVTGKPGRITHDPARPEASDGLQLWVDTRDTRDVHRATRFCHRFQVAILPARAGSEPTATVTQLPIHRAQADAPRAGRDLIKARVERLRQGWRLELFLPAESLHGFDPDTNRRLGFAYQVTDPDRGDQFLGVGREFPIAEDPSLWATLELRD
jgi:hypothetical protein